MDKTTKIKRLVSLVEWFQKLTKDWSPHRVIWLNDGVAMPPADEPLYVELRELMEELLPGARSADPVVVDAIKQAVPNVSVSAGEQDSSGWLTGVLRVNNLKLVFG